MILKKCTSSHAKYVSRQTCKKRQRTARSVAEKCMYICRGPFSIVPVLCFGKELPSPRSSSRQHGARVVRTHVVQGSTPVHVAPVPRSRGPSPQFLRQTRQVRLPPGVCRCNSSSTDKDRPPALTAACRDPAARCSDERWRVAFPTSRPATSNDACMPR